MRRKLQHGFTMVEMMVVLVILGILAAIAVPNLTAYLHLSQFRKNESFAKSMYLSAESSLTYRRSGGQWDVLADEITDGGVGIRNDTFSATDPLYHRIYALRLDAGEYSSGEVSADGQLVLDLLEDDTYDKSILNEAICIEVDVASGQVYSVFYGTNCDGLRYGRELTGDQSQAWLNMDQRDYDTRRAERLGYYSTQDVSNVVDLELTKLKITSISLVNSETLTLNWATNSKHDDHDVRFTIKLYNQASKAELLSMDLARPKGGSQVEATVTGQGVTAKTYTFPLTYTQEGRFVLTLDAMMTAAQLDGLEQTANNADVAKSSSTSITRFTSLSTAQDIYATVQAFPDTSTGIGGEYTASSAISSNDANTLYADGSTADKASLTTFRHLSNLRYGGDNATFTVSTRSLDWNSDNIVLYHTTDTTNAAGAVAAQAVLEPLKSSAVGFPTIPELKAGQTLNGSGGLLSRIASVFTGGNTISNLKLDATSVGGSAQYLGLFGQNRGTIQGVQLSNAVVTVENNATLLGVGALCGQSTGKLSDNACNVKMNVTLTNTKAQGIGGVAGKLTLNDAGSADQLSASGEIQGTVPADGTGGVGGIAGATTAWATMTDCENTANVTGNQRVGGVAGYVLGNGSTATGATSLQNCSNEGLILCSEPGGRYIGGVVGYGRNAKLDGCTSRAGNGITYSADQKDKLRGDYVGGILGYGSDSFVYNCSTQAGGYVLGRNYVGGIAGGLFAQKSTEEKISADPNKVTTNASYVIGQSYVGGILGQNSGTSISNCVNTGVAAGYGEYIGGICGRNEAGSTVKNCASYVSDTHNTIYNMVVGWGATGDYAGGLVGYNNGSIVFNNNTDNYVTTKSVASIVVGKNYVGGLVGFNDTNATIDVRYTIIGGRVAATGDCVGGLIGLNASPSLLAKELKVQPSSVQGEYFVGGAIGANVVNLTADTTLTGLTVDNSLGTVTAQAFCGGLIGYQRTYAAGQANGTADSLVKLLPGVDTANGNVPTAVAASTNPYQLTIQGQGNDNDHLKKASNNMTIRAYAYAGGIVGYCEGSSKLLLKDCLNEGAFDQPAANTFPNSPLKNGVDVVKYLNTQGYNNAAQALSAELNEDNKTQLRVAIVGGVMGVNGIDHVIDHCGNTGVMNGQTAMGGVVGLNEGLVTNCTLSGSMGSANQDYVGGIAGLNVGGKSTQNKTYGTKSYQAGTITACATGANNTVTGGHTVGGIVGYNLQGGTVEDNQSCANVTGTSRVGGIAGENGGTVSLAGNTAKNTRAVTGSGAGVGGILGVNTATGQLTTGATAGGGDAVVTDRHLTVTGQSKVGGIVGINRGQLGGKDASSYLTNHAKLVRATQGLAGGVVGAQEGSSAAALSYAKNLGEVIANKGAAGGIVGQNGQGRQVQHCVNAGNVTSNDGYAGGVVSENYGTIAACTVDGSSAVTITARGVKELGAVCAVNHTTGIVTGSTVTGTRIDLKGEASILGAIVGKNTGMVSATTVSQQPNYNVSASALTVGGAVGLNTEGGTVQTVTVKTNFKNFSNYHYLGGVVGENAQALTQGTQTKDTTVTGCAYSGTITENKSAVGNCYGGIAGLNEGLLDGNTVSALTITAKGVYTATSTSTAEQKEALSSHIGGIAGKNETTGTIRACYISNDANATSSITVHNGMVGGVTGYNKGTITLSGDASTKDLMDGVTKVSDLLANAKKQGLAADATWVKWDANNRVEEMQYNNGTALKNGRTMQIIVSSNGNLGGLAGYNSPTGEMSYCASGNWLLVNKSNSIGVGTGGMIGMNETEKDLTFLLNRAFVGRQLSSGQTNRFAGGIIGNQNNSTTDSWLIKGCVNYGTVYGYNSHYSGGIIGQWTNNGGTVEGCYNYGNLQTTVAFGWYGASGGIVAQLYHATSDQAFNIVSSQNHGNLYGRDGNSYGYWIGENFYGTCANDSGGILGNITAYQAEKGQGQHYTINVVDCVNGPGVEIYSASMSSGIVCFFSADGVANVDGNQANEIITNSTENIVLNIDRCRNYAQTLSAYRFTAGIFGDRYAYNRNKPATDTYIQNCFSITSGVKNYEIIRMSNGTSDTMNGNKVGNNYYFDDAWGITNQNASGSIQSDKNRDESRRAFSRMLAYGLFDQHLFAAVSGPTLTEMDNSATKEYGMYFNMTKENTSIDSHGIMTEKSSGKIVGRVIYDMPYSYEPYIFNHGASKLQNAIKDKNGKASDMDTYVHEGYRELEHDQTDNKLNNSFSLALSQADSGSFDVEITDNDRPLYYEGEVYVEGQTEPVLKNLRFLPNQKGQGQWDPKLDGTQSYGEGVTTGSFTLTKELLKENAGKIVTLRVRAVSQFEDTAPSEWVSQTITNTEFLPTPDVRVRLVSPYGNTYYYEYSLNNLADYKDFPDWKVTLSMIGSNTTLTLSAGKTTAEAAGQGLTELTATATATGKDPVTVRQATYTPENYKPDAQVAFDTVSVSGETLDDLVISADLKVTSGSVNTPPIYRVELLGRCNGETEDTVFAYEDVLVSASGVATANFRNLPEQIFQCSNLKVRAWYAMSGLGPVYTYNEVSKQLSRNVRILETNGEYTYLYSTVLAKQSGYFKDYVKTYNLDLTALPAPVLGEAVKHIGSDGSLSYTFSWDQGTNLNNGAQYTVRLMGVLSDGSQVGISTADVYTDPSAHSFTINADDWKYSSVILTVTRVGSGNSIGLSASKTYDVSQRLERPGQPVVSNPDTNELNYDISWAALADETGCGSYQLIVAKEAGTTEKLADVTAGGQSSYSVQVDLEPYAGQRITLYLVAKGSGGYADSPNGVSYGMTVPKRVNQPTVDWSTNFTYDNTYSVADFEGGKLTVTVTPDANSIPPGGSTYLLRAVIYGDAACTKQLNVYPGSGLVSAMSDSGGNHRYTLALNNLSAWYAGKWIQFEARISSAAGQVSSQWVTCPTVYRLPRVQLDTPVTAMDYRDVETLVNIVSIPGLPGTEETWSARRTLVTWPGVTHADGVKLTLTDQNGQEFCFQIRLNAEGKIEKIEKIENLDGTAENYLTMYPDGYYHLVKATDTGRYTPTGSAVSQPYTYAADTLLRQEDGVLVLSLPNLSTLTTKDGQVLTIGKTLMQSVRIQATTSSSEAYADSAERELAFGN